jgi:hypothetical protein
LPTYIFMGRLLNTVLMSTDRGYGDQSVVQLAELQAGAKQ